MAHLGDLLPYRLDRIATEAWLGTARRRASVTRHARSSTSRCRPRSAPSTVVQVQVAHPNLTATDAGLHRPARRPGHRRRGRPRHARPARPASPSRSTGRRRCSPRTARSPSTTGARSTPSSPPGRRAPCSSGPRRPTPRPLATWLPAGRPARVRGRRPGTAPGSRRPGRPGAELAPRRRQRWPDPDAAREPPGPGRHGHPRRGDHRPARADACPSSGCSGTPPTR